MVKIRDNAHILADGSIDLQAWLQDKAKNHSQHDMHPINLACGLAQVAGEEHPTYTGETCLLQGLTMADVLDELKLDPDCIAAAIVYPSTQYAELTIEDIEEHLGERIAKIVEGVEKMDAIRGFGSHAPTHEHNKHHIDNLRKMLLAMVDDVRVVLIKLAERLSMIRSVAKLDSNKQKIIAQETMNVYAPLANRLGIATLKWELEDLAFRFLEPERYKKLAKQLSERRIDREKYVADVVQTLKNNLHEFGIKHAEVQGRAKHIYSINKKMLRKSVDFSKIYDAIAVRILVDSIEDSYAALSMVHSNWKHIPEEFDDYITAPKPNGYRSLHTAVVGPNNKNIEVQIRTHTMHNEAELGVAAHWVYKEGAKPQAGYEDKIAWLRQVLAWQKDLTADEAIISSQDSQMISDRVYIFTPAGEVIDLPTGATPLDFAYHIHSEIGHRCRGAKVNGKMVNLTYQLQIGEQVEILTTSKPSPSRDWLNPHLGYLKSSKSKAKVHHWFKKQDYDKNLHEGQAAMERECKRLNIPKIDYTKVAHKLNFKTAKDLLAAVGRGDAKVSQVINLAAAPLSKQPDDETPVIHVKHKQKGSKHVSDINVQGIGDLLTNIAKCCQPVPGESIIGFVTQGRGVTVHRKDCLNMLHASKDKSYRLIEVEWGHSTESTYDVNIRIVAYDRKGLLRDITAILSNEKVNLVAVNTTTDKMEHTSTTIMTVEITDLALLSKIIHRLTVLPNIIQVDRVQS